jgi:hypothetical protein
MARRGLGLWLGLTLIVTVSVARVRKLILLYDVPSQGGGGER